MTVKPFVSVVIPVYNDAINLRLGLSALKEQTYGAENYEVLIVDNGSDDDVQSLKDQFPDFRFEYEERIGSYAARNKGISLAKGEIIALTDSDAIPFPSWLEAGVNALLGDPDVALVGGKITVFPRNPSRITLGDRHEILCGFNNKGCIEQAGFALTANLITYKKIFTDVGLFDPSLKSVGDVEWGFRFLAKGYKPGYLEGAGVRHPSRRSLGKIGKRHIRIMGGYFQSKHNKTELSEKIIGNLKNYFSPTRQIKQYWFLYPRKLTVKDKTAIVVVEFFLFFVRWVEYIRLSLGGKPKRA